MKGKILGIIRVVAGVLILIAGLGKFGGDMSQVGGAAPALLPFLWFMSNTAWGRAAAIWQVLAGAGLILWYKTRLAGLLAAIIMIFAWNVIGWELDPKLLIILLWALIAAFMWWGDFSLESMLRGGFSKAGAVTWAVAGGIGWVWNVVKGAGSVIGDSVGKAASTATGAVWSVAGGVADVAGSAVDAAGSVAGGVVDAAGSAASTATGAVWSVAGGVADAAWSVAGWAADAVKGAGGLIWGLAGWLWDMAGWVIDKWWDMAKGVVTAVADKVDAATGWVASGIIDKVEDMAEDLIEKAEDMVEEVIDVE